MIKLSDEKQRELDDIVNHFENAGIDIEEMIRSQLEFFAQQGFLKEGKPNAIVKRQKLPRKLKKKLKKEHLYAFDITRRYVPARKVEIDLKECML